MASSAIQSNKVMKRLQSRKSHSWWWDSHISSKNSKWLAENLEEMDRNVKRMLKLIEEDGDSFAKKAEMYYQKRPELISLVEEFYRMYRSLAERYDHVTGELRKNIPTDLQSQVSGISDVGSEPPSSWPSPVPDQRPSRRKSARAPGFEVFLGSAGSSSELCQKEGYESSTLTDSDFESDDSSVNNYSIISGNGEDQGLNRKITELEVELRELKEKLKLQQDANSGESSPEMRKQNSEDLFLRIAEYEQQLKIANSRIHVSEEETARLIMELQKYKSSGLTNGSQAKFKPSTEKKIETEETEQEAETLDSNRKIWSLEEELKVTKQKLQDSEKEIASLKLQLENDRTEKSSNLQDQLALSQREANTWKTKSNAEKREVTKLQERIARLKTSLTDRDHEVRELKIAVSDAEQKIFPEKAQIKAKISKLSEEKTCLEEQLKESESHVRSLEDDIRMLQAEKMEVEERLHFQIKQLTTDIADRDDCIENLNSNLDALKAQRDELNAKISTLNGELITRDDQINQMDKHLQQLRKEHAKLISETNEAYKLVGELRLKSDDLEKEVERQRIVILEGAEKKREAIRQLCFSLEHYRNGYHRLRQAYMGHKRISVLAA